MKKIKFILLMTTTILITTEHLKGQEKFGNTLNIGAGIGYYGFNNAYYRTAIPAINLNYEFDIVKNLTLAPYMSFSSYRGYQYWGNQNYVYRDYTYRQTIIPIGIKASYYFDELLSASDKWDFYLGLSSGFIYRNTVWESGYYGERNSYASLSPLFINLHIGTEVHLTSKIGLYLDLSTGMSTLGLGLHF